MLFSYTYQGPQVPHHRAIVDALLSDKLILEILIVQLLTFQAKHREKVAFDLVIGDWPSSLSTIETDFVIEFTKL